MNELEKFFKGLDEKFFKNLFQFVTPQTKDTGAETIQVDLPESPSRSNFVAGPSGNIEYEDACAAWQALCNSKIIAAVPRGYNLKSSEVKEVKQVVRHYASIVVEKA